MQYKLTDLCNPKQWKTLATNELVADGKYLVYGANGIIGKYDDYNHKEKTLMITCRGATCGNVHISEPYSYINGNAMCLDNLDTSKCDIKYLYFYLKNYDMKNVISGSAQPQITINSLNKVMIKIIPLSEQKNIVKLFEKIENGIIIKKNEILKLDEIIKSQFVEMFGNPVLNEKGFNKKKLFDKCDIVTGNTPSRKIYDYYGNYIEWIKSDNIIDNSTYLSLAKESLSEKGLKVGRYVDKDCILMTCIAGSLNSIGNVAITDRKVSFNQQINGIIPKENDVYFMYEQFVLSKDYLHSPVNMSLKGILSKNQLGNLEFIFPPIELQKQFGKFFKQVDKQKFNEVLYSLKYIKNMLKCKC